MRTETEVEKVSALTIGHLGAPKRGVVPTIAERAPIVGGEDQQRVVCARTRTRPQARPGSEAARRLSPHMPRMRSASAIAPTAESSSHTIPPNVFRFSTVTLPS